MELHGLKPAKGAVKSKKRIARGQGSGRGGTSTRGHKGAKSRSGYKSKRGFEGGQMPIQQRLPKRGFKSPNRIEVTPFNLSKLQAIADKYKVSEITLEWLRSNRMIKKTEVIKVLGNGAITSQVKVEAHAASETATKAIEAAGGSVQIVEA